MTFTSHSDVILPPQKKIYRFATFSILVIAINVVINFLRGHVVSVILDLLFDLSLLIILFFIRYRKTKHITSIIFITSNFFLILLIFAEGLNFGGFFYFFSVLFAIPFLLSNSKNRMVKTILYLSFTVCSFSICLFFCKPISTWQHISLKAVSTGFTFNCLCAAVLCSIFAYIGIFFEKKAKEELIDAKRKAEKHKLKVEEQNAMLKDIAYLNAHIVRAPLANILALASLIDENKIQDNETKELIHYLQESVEKLDNSIKETISKTSPL